MSYDLLSVAAIGLWTIGFTVVMVAFIRRTLAGSSAQKEFFDASCRRADRLNALAAAHDEGITPPARALAEILTRRLMERSSRVRQLVERLHRALDDRLREGRLDDGDKLGASATRLLGVSIDFLKIAQDCMNLLLQRSTGLATRVSLHAADLELLRTFLAPYLRSERPDPEDEERFARCLRWKEAFRSEVQFASKALLTVAESQRDAMRAAWDAAAALGDRELEEAAAKEHAVGMSELEEVKAAAGAAMEGLKQCGCEEILPQLRAEGISQGVEWLRGAGS